MAKPYFPDPDEVLGGTEEQQPHFPSFEEVGMEPAKNPPEQAKQALKPFFPSFAEAGLEKTTDLAAQPFWSKQIYGARTEERAEKLPLQIEQKAEKMKALAEGPLAPELKAKIEEIQEAVMPYMPMGPETEEEYRKRTDPNWYKTPMQKRMGEHWKKVGAEKGKISATPTQPLPEPGKHRGLLGELDVPFGAPFRAVAGAAKSAQDWLDYALTPEGFEGVQKPEGFGKTVWKSVSYEEPVYMGDVFETAMRRSLARELQPWERYLAHGAGIFSEIMGPGQTLKLLRLGKGGPAQFTVAKRAGQALRSEGVPVVGSKPFTKTFWRGRLKPAAEVQIAPESHAVTRHELARLGQRVVEGRTHPQRIEKLIEEVRAVGKNLGMDDARIAALERKVIQAIGKEGTRLERGGLRLARPLSEKQAMEVQVGEAKRQMGKRYPIRIEPAPPTAPTMAEKRSMPGLKLSPMERRKAYAESERIKKYQQEQMRAPKPTPKISYEVPGVPQEIIERTPKREVPFGAERVGIQKWPVIGKFFYGKDLPTGGVEVFRQSDAYQHLASMEAVREGRQVEKVIASPERSRYISKLKDMQYNQRILDSAWDDFAKLTDRNMQYAHKKAMGKAVDESMLTTPEQMAAKAENLKRMEKEIQLSYQRTGLTEAEVRTGYKAKTPEEGKVVADVERALSDMRKVERSKGIPVRQIDEDAYVFRTATDEVRELRGKVIGKRRGKKLSESFAQARKKYLNISLGGTRNMEFIEEMGSWYAARKHAHAIGVANADAEAAILKGYGRRIHDAEAKRFLGRGATAQELAMNPEYIRTLQQRGLTTYATRTRGVKEWHVIDEKMGRFLENKLTREATNQVLKYWMQFHNWWKAGATVFRPGFTFRNVLGGNIWQLWQADADVIPAMFDGIRAGIKVSRRRGLGRMPIQETILRDLEKAAGREVTATNKFGMYRNLDEAIDAGLQHGVSAEGFFGREMGMVTEGGRVKLNPLSTKGWLMRGNAKLNRMGEDIARWALFLDRLKKGYSAREAAAAVAKYIFNYNELAAFGRGARHIWSFSTWNLKNWGMQIATLMNKPDKFFNFARLWYGIQGMDPLTSEQVLGMPEYAEGALPFVVPHARGSEEGGRLWFIGSGVFPMANLLQLGDPPRAIGEMMNPVFRNFVDFLIERAKSGEPFQREHARKEYEGYIRTPTYMENAFIWLDNNLPPLSDIMKQALGVKAAIDWSTGRFSAYKWPIETADFFNMAVPQVATVNRVFRYADDRTYDTLWSYVFGIKPQELTQERMKWNRERRLSKLQGVLNALTKPFTQLGTLPDPKNLLRNPPALLGEEEGGTLR